MGALEKVIQLKNAGWGDDQIINNLQQQGISPNEINNALSQAEIKNAVSGDEMELPTPNQNYSQQRMPMTQEMQEPQGEYSQEYPQQEYGQEEYYPQENYQQGSSGGSFDTDTIIEIAEQVIENKTKKIENHIEELNEFKTLTKTKVDNIDERLRKIESMIDKLQITILEKIGSYGQNIGEIKKEMSMMQDSFGKMINNVADKNSSTIKKISKKNI